MASRINVKFVLILTASVLMLALTVSAAFIWRSRQSATQNLKKADAYAQEGDFREAYKWYGRAVVKSPGNQENLAKFEDALHRVIPTGRDEARELYEAKLGILKNRTRYQRLNAEHHLALIDELVLAGRIMKGDSMWVAVDEAAETMWGDLPESDPARVEARLYRAMATFQRAMVLTDDDMAEALADINAYVEARPDGDLGWGTMIAGRLALLDRARSEGNRVRVAEMEADLEATVRRARESSDGPETARAIVVYLALRQIQTPELADEEALRQAADTMIDVVTRSEDPLLILDAAELLDGLAWLGYGEAAADLLSAHVAANPDAIHHRARLVRMLVKNRRFDEAVDHAEAVIAAEYLPASVESQFQDRFQRMSLALLVDVAQGEWEDASADERAALVPDIETAVGRLREVTVDPENDRLLLLAEGKLAFAKGDYILAASRFNRLAEPAEAATPEVLLYASRALEETNEMGLAYERLKMLAEKQPGRSRVLYDCARLAYNLRDWDACEDWINRVLEVAPDYAPARELASRLAGERAGTENVQLTGIAQAIDEAERLLVTGEHDSARAVIQAALETNPDNARLLVALLQVEINAGRVTEAEAIVDDLLVREPEDELLLQLKASLSTDDPVEAIRLYAASASDSEAEHAITLVVNLAALAESRRAAGDRSETRGDIEAAARSREIADRAEAALQEATAEAERLAPDDRRFLEYRFRQTIMAEDWEAAQAVVQRARQTDADLARGLVFEGQLALVRGNAGEAARLLAAATERVPHSSQAWRALAIAYEEVGNFGEAREAWESAYRTNPNDVDTVRRYVTLLNQIGENTRALLIMRQARRLLPRDQRLREAWLRLEQDAGDRGEVYRERLFLHEDDPDDRVNAMALAAFLSTAEPAREYIIEADGTPSYSEFQWARLNATEQRRLLAALDEGWHDLSLQIVEGLDESQPDDLQVALLRARLLREHGDVQAAEQSLRDFVDRNAESEQKVAMRVELSRFLAAIGRVDEAVSTLEAARSTQDPEKREIDIAIGDLHFDELRFDLACAAYERAAETNDAENLRLRIVECYTRLGRFDDARTALESWMDDGRDGYFEQMLLATICDGEGHRAADAGDEETASRRFALRDEAFEEARRLSPSNPGPHIERAQALLRGYSRRLSAATVDEAETMSHSSAELDEALIALEQAEQIRAGNPRTTLTRATIFQARGDTMAAIGELERLLDRLPDMVGTRQRLAELKYVSDDFGGAVEVVAEGMRRQPQLTRWPEIIGDMHLDRYFQTRGRPNRDARKLDALLAEAVAAYDKALEIKASPQLLSKLVTAVLNEEPPDYAAAVEAIERFPELIQSSLVVSSLYARALHGAGRVEDARAQIAAGWARRGDSDLTPWYNAIDAIYFERPPQEVEAFVREVAGDPLHPLQTSWIASVWARQGAAGLDRALELQRAAVEADDNRDEVVTASLYFNLAGLLISAGQFDEAVLPLKRTIEHNPRHIQALNNYAYLLSQQGKSAEALLFATDAKNQLGRSTTNSLRSSVLDTLGWIYRETGDAEQAERSLRQSLEAMETPHNCLHLARVLIDKGEDRQALSYLEEAAKLRPDQQTQGEINDLAADIRTRLR